MKPLSPSADRVCCIAVEHFADRGYDASSLNDIAEQAGMRKASLYAHFANKDALYLAALGKAAAAETTFAQAHFSAAEPDADQRWFEGLRARYQGSVNLRFLLRAAFYPPAALREPIGEVFEGYLDDLKEGAQRAQSQRKVQAPQLLVEGWIALLDSLHVELIYGNDDVYGRRLHALQWMLGAAENQNPSDR